MEGTLNEIIKNTNWKLIEKNRIFNSKILKDLNLYNNYGKKWIVLVDGHGSKNYYERYSYYICCFTGKKYRNNWQSKLKWAANCHIFVKCPNPECENWIEYEWNIKYGALNNFNLINDFPNCCNLCNSNYKNPGICSICRTFNFTRDQNHRGRDSYENIKKNNIKDKNSIYSGCDCSEQWFLKHNNDIDFIKIVGKASAERWKNSEYSAKISKNLGNYLGNPDWAREVGKLGREAIKYLLENNEEYAKKASERAIQLGYEWGHKTIYKAIEAQKKLRENNPEWVKRQTEITKANVKLAQEMNKWLWENDSEWVKRQTEIYRKNFQKAKEKRIEKIKEFIHNTPIKINQNSINISNILELKKQDICGAYVIKAKFKEDIKTEKEGIVYNLLVCKSKRVYDEIYWVLRVISQPEKQDKNAEWTTAKWWYIANLYYEFEFELLTDIKGVSEEEALLCEYKYGYDNDLFVEFEKDSQDNKGDRIPKIDKHSYWSL